MYRLITIVLLVTGCATPQHSPSSTDQQSSAAKSVSATAAISTSTATAATKAALAHIEQLEPRYNAVIAVAADAPAQAEALDRLASSGSIGPLPGPLQGRPVLLKDNIESRELPTTAGSLALSNNNTGRDAPLVKALRDAGAVIVGKANLSEWANFRSTHSSSGWSGVGGQTNNAHDPRRNPCGSSSGSAVAVAVGMVPLAVGTETNGSIVCPASINGIVGIKPTVGLISRTHVVPISHSQDTAGPMARDVRTAVLGLQAMAQHDPQDFASAELPATTWQRNYLDALDADGLRGKRIGLLGGGFHPGVDELFQQAQADLAAAGAIVVPDLSLDRPDGFGAAQFDVLMYEFKHDLNRYLSTLPDPRLSQLNLADLIAFNTRQADRSMPWFGQEIFEQSQAKGPLTDADYSGKLTLIQTATRKNGIDRLLKEHQLDAIVSPTTSPAWFTDHVNGDHYIGGNSGFAAIAGYPSITVPMGFVHDLPVGLLVYGAKLSEPTLIQIAYGYEQVTKHWRAPINR